MPYEQKIEYPKLYYHREIYKQIFTKELKLGITAKTINKVWKDFIPEFNVMLAEKYWDKKCDCGKKLNPDEIAMNYKLFGRYEDISANEDNRQLYCKECMCKKLGITSKEYSEKVMEFRLQGCELF